MHYNYKTNGTCSKEIDFEINDNKLSNVSFTGGCNGNLKAIASLVEGQDIDEVIKRCKGINCNNKGTSCADQLARTLESTKVKL